MVGAFERSSLLEEGLIFYFRGLAPPPIEMKLHWKEYPLLLASNRAVGRVLISPVGLTAPFSRGVCRVPLLVARSLRPTGECTPGGKQTFVPEPTRGAAGKNTRSWKHLHESSRHRPKWALHQGGQEFSVRTLPVPLGKFSVRAGLPAGNSGIGPIKGPVSRGSLEGESFPRPSLGYVVTPQKLLRPRASHFTGFVFCVSTDIFRDWCHSGPLR